MLSHAVVRIENQVKSILERATNLTLGLDGWTIVVSEIQLANPKSEITKLCNYNYVITYFHNTKIISDTSIIANASIKSSISWFFDSEAVRVDERWLSTTDLCFHSTETLQ
ncbi:hypothetical protein RhiirC2_788750 [Rhizophagus irregularis]|uniref:Uncharacterized protein n=1 Tax=Rhizophagus irregularis TaxID=588596 RepID=A0A2N1MPG2_9GLOM|nr:hypothetical protein RhiirC2_788750 [Rhizophagus irregularis]